MESNTSFFNELLKRRVLQIFGIYLGATVALMEFSGIIVERYGVSDGFIDYVLAAMVTFIPGVLLLAWRHGAPGKDKWGKPEKFGLPLNLLLVIIVLISLNTSQNQLNYENKGIQETAAVSTEAKISIPRLGLYFFDQDSSVEKSWMGQGLSWLVSAQMYQSPSISTMSLYNDNFLWEIQRAGFTDGKNIPQALARNVAQNNQLDYFVRGSLSKSSDAYKLTLKIYETETGRVLRESNFSNSDIFMLAEAVASDVRSLQQLNIAADENLNQIPLKEFTTSDQQALEYYLAGLNERFLRNNYTAAIENIEKAVEADSEFVLATIFLGELQIVQGNFSEANKWFRYSLNLSYKLTPTMQLFTRAALHATEENIPEQINVYRNWIELHPNDFRPRNQLAFLLTFRGGTWEEINELRQRSLELNPAQPSLYSDLAFGLIKMGRLDDAKAMYLRHRELRPESEDPLVGLGNVEMMQGNLEAAERYFQQASLLALDKVTPILRLAEIAFRRGKLEQMNRKLRDAEIISQAPRQLALLETTNLFIAQLSGQPEKAFKHLQVYQQAVAKISNPLDSAFSAYVSQTQIYIDTGRENEIVAQLENLKQQIDSSISGLVDLGLVFIAIREKDFELAKSLLANTDQIIKRFQLKQIFYVSSYAKSWLAYTQKDTENGLQWIDLAKQQLAISAVDGEKIFFEIIALEARLLQQKGDHTTAANLLKDSLTRWPYHPSLNLLLSKSLLKLGDQEEGLEALEKARSILISAEDDSELKTMLDEISAQYRS